MSKVSIDTNLVQKLKTGKVGPGELHTTIESVKKQVSAVNGSTLIMTLFSGSNIVRFLIPNSAPTSSGSVGKYSEGVSDNLAVALAIALAGLSS